ncbi:hypothetical protein TREMEDRAFT_65668 [Tremella mesenterica DSM 1558]|uniref:uncharacterized protein n=1 Tax=Tremella mesenterica (strain ATCC 24925 / CBS 8224 / DSM 1558 / NBRC 9311 / NRRL Y-6157 / RJB 2259-6 / UBC 559-6) TaxID=578456 RepID=UPI00032BDB2D|nr:uncharacterized protein TREMEDRAFT_65668 [Tremella mesenterica DSM 1558]EIW66385.1 hypothetical protein TREMEDRAFT_65668 [Tremella mesenterica DSM 1558]
MSHHDQQPHWERSSGSRSTHPPVLPLRHQDDPRETQRHHAPQGSLHPNRHQDLDGEHYTESRYDRSYGFPPLVQPRPPIHSSGPPTTSASSFHVFYPSDPSPNTTNHVGPSRQPPSRYMNPSETASQWTSRYPQPSTSLVFDEKESRPVQWGRNQSSFNKSKQDFPNKSHTYPPTLTLPIAPPTQSTSLERRMEGNKSKSWPSHELHSQHLDSRSSIRSTPFPPLPSTKNDEAGSTRTLAGTLKTNIATPGSSSRDTWMTDQPRVTEHPGTHFEPHRHPLPPAVYPGLTVGSTRLRGFQPDYHRPTTVRLPPASSSAINGTECIKAGTVEVHLIRLHKSAHWEEDKGEREEVGIGYGV